MAEERLAGPRRQTRTALLAVLLGREIVPSTEAAGQYAIAQASESASQPASQHQQRMTCLAIGIPQRAGGGGAHHSDDLQQRSQLRRPPPDAAVVGGAQARGPWRRSSGGTGTCLFWGNGGECAYPREHGRAAMQEGRWRCLRPTSPALQAAAAQQKPVGITSAATTESAQPSPAQLVRLPAAAAWARAKLGAGPHSRGSYFFHGDPGAPGDSWGGRSPWAAEALESAESAMPRSSSIRKAVALLRKVRIISCSRCLWATTAAQGGGRGAGVGWGGRRAELSPSGARVGQEAFHRPGFP